MPLHVGDNKDMGGNLTPLRWFDRGSNMHRVWDSGIIEWAGDTEDFWLAELAELGAAENVDLPSAGFDSLQGPSQPLRSPIARRSDRPKHRRASLRASVSLDRSAQCNHQDSLTVSNRL